ncbi:unnamed protein product, partial [Prorocentrum cordatum]
EYIKGANMGWNCAGCWIRHFEDNGFPTPAGAKPTDKIREYEQQLSGTCNDRASVLPSLGLLPLGYGCSPLADTRQLDDLLMEPTGMKIPERANTTIPVGAADEAARAAGIAASSAKAAEDLRARR